MAVSTDRFKVTSIRPEAHLHTPEVPQDLRDRVEGKIVTVEDLEKLGADVKTSRLYHGGESLVDVYWHGQEYVLYLEPVTEESE
ncbi:MAG: hypothetical protein M1370_09690 [Bacteroidetes bacterium]|nr:hypothetical protein [Bacteroidota bacterium]